MIIGGEPSAEACAVKPTSSPGTAAVGITNHARIGELEQRKRDQDRRAILEQELQQEQQTLTAQLRAGSGADTAALIRTRSNLVALQRELARNGP